MLNVHSKTTLLKKRLKKLFINWVEGKKAKKAKVAETNEGVIAGDEALTQV